MGDGGTLRSKHEAQRRCPVLADLPARTLAGVDGLPPRLRDSTVSPNARDAWCDTRWSGRSVGGRRRRGRGVGEGSSSGWKVLFHCGWPFLV